MNPLQSKPTFYYQCRSAFFMPTLLVLGLLALSACATTQPSPESTPASEADSKAPSAEATAQPSSETAEQVAESTQSTEVAPSDAPGIEPAPPAPATPEPVHIVESCKDEPFSKYEKQARDSMAKGLAAMKEEKFGVGFRNAAEHKKWGDTHNKLFSSVNEACNALSQCAKQHPKDKTTQCTKQASQFKQWQDIAERFAKNAKLAETTQPPKICSFEPSLDDAADCFHGLADNIDKACNTAACKEASDCWRGIGFLDAAINQASSACAFARTPLAECRGYVTATQRRENKFKRCNAMQDQLNITVLPVL